MRRRQRRVAADDRGVTSGRCRNHRVVHLDSPRSQAGDQDERRRVLRRVRVFLVGEAQHADHGVGLVVEQLRVEHAQRPVAPMLAVANEGRHHAGLDALLGGEPEHGGEVTLEISAGQAESRRQIRVSADAPVETERRRDLGPVGPHALRKLGEAVRDAH